MPTASATLASTAYSVTSPTMNRACLPTANPSGRHVHVKSLSTPMAATISAVRPAAALESCGPRSPRAPDWSPGMKLLPAWPAVCPTHVTSDIWRFQPIDHPLISEEISTSLTRACVDEPCTKAMSAHNLNDQFGPEVVHAVVRDHPDVT